EATSTELPLLGCFASLAMTRLGLGRCHEQTPNQKCHPGDPGFRRDKSRGPSDSPVCRSRPWIPSFAGMTNFVLAGGTRNPSATNPTTERGQQMPNPLTALARLMRPHEEKQSRVAPAIAFHTLGRPVWTPRDYAALADEGFQRNAVAYRCVRAIAEAA